MFAPKLENFLNNCFANTCLTVLGSTPHGLGRINRFIHDNLEDANNKELAKLLENAVKSSYSQKMVNIFPIIKIIDSSLKVGEQEDIFPFISSLAEKLGFGEENIFPRTGETLFKCQECGEISRTKNVQSSVTLFHMNGRNLLEDFAKSLHEDLKKRCSKCQKNTIHESNHSIDESKYLMLRPSNLVHSVQVDQLKDIPSIGVISLVGFATREGDAQGKSGHWWFTRINKDSTSLRLDGVQQKHQDVMTTTSQIPQGNLFIFKRLKRPLPNPPPSKFLTTPLPSTVQPASFPIASSSSSSSSSSSNISNSPCSNSPERSSCSNSLSPISSPLSTPPPSPSPSILVTEGEESEVEMSEEEVTQPPPVKRGEKILQTSCVICDKMFSKAANVRRHMIKIHQMDFNQVKALKIENTSKQCTWCGVMQKNLTTHHRHCKKFLKFQSIVKIKKVETEKEPTLLPPKKQVKGTSEFIRLFSNFMNSNGPKAILKRYIRLVENMLMYWEAKIVNFFCLNLLYPLQTQAVFPSSFDFLTTVKNDFARVDAAKAFKHLCLFVLQHFQKSSSALVEFSFQEKTAWEHHVQARMMENSGTIKGHNKVASLATAINKQSQRAEGKGHDLRHNSQRIMAHFQHISNLKSVHDAVLSIRDTPEIWNEEHARKLLVCILIIFSGGIRPSVALRLTIKEFRDAVQTEDGTMVAQVLGSKTILSWGLAPLPFFYNGVYDAISSYISYFKSSAEDDHAVFSVNSDGNPQSFARDHFIYFKKQFLEGYFTNPTEQRTFTPKIWRHGWANWKHQNPSKTIRNLGQHAMGQSTETVIKNYADSIPENVIKFGRAIMSNLVKFDDAELDNDQKPVMRKRQREDSETSSDSEPTSSLKKSRVLPSQVRKGTCFLPNDRDYLRKLFFKDNQPPTSLEVSMIKKLEREDPTFKRIWTQTLEKKAEEARLNGATEEEADRKAAIAAKAALRKTLTIGGKKKKKKEDYSEDDHYDYPAGRSTMIL